MAHVRSLAGFNDTGFDPDRNLLVVPAGKTASLYLVDTSVLGTDVVPDDPTVATVAEKDQTKQLSNSKKLRPDERGHAVSKLTVKGLRVGTTELRSAETVGSEAIDPVEVRVVADADARQSGEKGAITPELRDELQSLTLREAVLRVAEDQMYSKIGRSAGGFGRYADKAYDWCGAFAWYCWSVACAVKGVPNPFGDKNGSLLSVQKAISYALQTDRATILRYEGGDPYGNSFTTGKALKKGELERQEYIEISPENPVEPADIVLVRAGAANGWKHVALVWETPTGDDLVSIDGNQGNPCIRKRTRSMKEKIGGKHHALVFLHVHV